MRKPKIRWLTVDQANVERPAKLYELELFARPWFGDERKAIRLRDAPLSFRSCRRFILLEPWMCLDGFVNMGSVRVGWPPNNSKIRWWQLRLVLVQKMDVGIGYVDTDLDPVDMFSLEADACVVDRPFWNKQQAHKYTAAWPKEDA